MTPTQGGVQPDYATQWADYYRLQVHLHLHLHLHLHPHLHLRLHLMHLMHLMHLLQLLQGMDREAQMIETFVKGLEAGRQESRAAGGRWGPGT